MIVSNNYTGGVKNHRGFENFAGVDQASVESTDGNYLAFDQFALGVQVKRREMLFF